MKKTLLLNIKRYPLLYLMALPVIAWYIVFHYIPMYGVLISFQDFVPARGILKSSWVGFEHFENFITGKYFWRLIYNTLSINLIDLVFGFPVPIIFALLLNEIKSEKFKKVTQTITYLPHFISSVVICGLIIDFVKSRGIIPHFLSYFGVEPFNLLTAPELFKIIFVSSNIWQGFGWGSIIYLAALSGIDPGLYEAAKIDGAGRFKSAIYISLPSIMPTIVILLIMRIGRLMSLGWENIILLYNPNIYETADVISTYVYRRGLENFDFSFASAVGLFNSLINMILLLLANKLSRSLNDTSLW